MDDYKKMILSKTKSAITVKQTKSLGSAFLNQVRKFPNHLAVKDKVKDLSYKQLQALVLSLTHEILNQNLYENKPVVLLMEKSCDQVAAILAVLNCGLIYVSIDSSYPYQRISYILEELEAELIITDNERSLIAAQLAEGKCNLINVGSSLKDFNVKKYHFQYEANTPACIIYTSGSSGEPKGVVHNHKNILHLAKQHIRDLQINENDRLSLLGSLCHVSGITDLFRGLLCGASVHLCDINKDNIINLARWVKKEQITVYHSVPTVFRFLVKHMKKKDELSSIRIIHLGGERALKSDFLLFKNNFKDSCVLMNNLGCSELSSFRNLALTKKSSVKDDIIPAGYSVDGKQVAIVNEKLQKIAPKEIGEICLLSNYLFIGYWKRNDLTKLAFVNIDEDGSLKRMYRTGDIGYLDERGCLYHLGRKDNQIKIRGNRIELGEIEECLKRHETVEFAIVKPSESREQLDCFILPAVSYAKAIEGYLRYQLPNQMMIVHQNSVETDHLYQNCFIDQSYLENDISLKPGDCVVDVGANIGMFSLFVSSICNDLDIYSIEPIPDLYNKLRINCSLYAKSSVALNYGLSDTVGEESFFYYPMQSTMSCQWNLAEEQIDKDLLKRHFDELLNKNESYKKTSDDERNAIVSKRMEKVKATCRLTTLSEIIRAESIPVINLLKIDVQRSELKVLLGIESEHWQRIKQIAMEIHDEPETLTHGNRKKIVELLEGKGYLVSIEQEIFREGTDRYIIYAIQSGYEGQQSKFKERPSPIVKKVPMLPLISQKALLIHCKENLPSYMIPQNFVFLDKVPLSPSGKILYNNLVIPENYTEGDFAPPETEQEVALASLWSEVVPHFPISKTDNFFEIGGHSLAVVELALLIEERYGKRINYTDVYEYQTIEEMAKYLMTSKESLNNEVIHKILYNNQKNNLFLVHTLAGKTLGYSKLSPYLKDHFNVYGIQSPFLLDKTEKIPETMEGLASLYINKLKQIQKTGPYYIGGACIGGMIAYEMGVQLMKGGEDVKFVAMIDPPNPYKCIRFLLLKAKIKNRLREFMTKRISFMRRLNSTKKFKRKPSGAQRKIKNKTAHETKLIRLHRLIRDNYFPSPINAVVLYFFANNSREIGLILHDPMHGWNHFARNIKIYNLNIRHTELLEINDSKQIAKLIISNQ